MMSYLMKSGVTPMPEKDEQVSYRQFTFTVKAVDKRRIKQVMVTLAKPEPEPDYLE
jgi:CBS domain containing-hemolysin-like protein